MIPYRVDAGIKLYKEGLINKILVTGGVVLSVLDNPQKLNIYTVIDGKTDEYSWYKTKYGKKIIKNEAIFLNYMAKKNCRFDYDIDI